VSDDIVSLVGDRTVKRTSQIHHSTTTQVVYHTNVIVLDEATGERKRGLDLYWGAELTAVNDFLHAAYGRMEPVQKRLGTHRGRVMCGLPVVKGLKESSTFFLSKCKHLACLFGSIRAWLFKEDMFSSCECLHSPLIVEAVGQL